MTEDFKTFYFQPLKLLRLLDFMIVRTDISSSRIKTKGLDFLYYVVSIIIGSNMYLFGT